MTDQLQIGKWLGFDAGTCFGQTKFHFGILLGIDNEKQIAVVAVNATSQIEKLIRFADLNNIPVEDAMVDVTSDVHFSEPTGIDCHRPQEIPLSLLNEWVKMNKVKKSAFNEDVDRTKYKQILEIVLRSPLVEPSIKVIIKNSNKQILSDND